MMYYGNIVALWSWWGGVGWGFFWLGASGKSSLRRQHFGLACDNKQQVRSGRRAFQAIKIAKQWQPTPVLLPGKSHGWSSLVGCSPWGCKESDTTEWLHFHFSFSCIGEGNGNPLQCSCLENPRDGGAWCAAVYGGCTESDITEAT